MCLRYCTVKYPSVCCSSTEKFMHNNDTENVVKISKINVLPLY